MFCTKCGKEIANDAVFCKYCGTKVEPDVKSFVKKYPNGDEERKSKKKIDPSIIIYIVTAILILLGASGIFLYVTGNIPFSRDGSIGSIMQSDEDLIVGSWRMDTSGYGEGIEAIGNLSGKIVTITFLSDGTCVVGNGSNAETGTWSITDGQLIVKGDVGGMFWNYNGFASGYSLDGDVLTVYHGDSPDVYYRE